MHEVFSLIDRDEKGWIGLHDLERLLSEYKVSARSLLTDLMLVLAAFDGSGKRKAITLNDFTYSITPKTDLE